jgi:hypothetical protein
VLGSSQTPASGWGSGHPRSQMEVLTPSLALGFVMARNGGQTWTSSKLTEGGICLYDPQCGCMTGPWWRWRWSHESTSEEDHHLQRVRRQASLGQVREAVGVRETG